MLVSDLLHSCANDCVAEAAISSIGGEFASRIRFEAGQRGVSVGHLASGLVRDFSRTASERDWRDLIDAVRGQDFPVLSGLQVILTKPSNTKRLRDDRIETRRSAVAVAAVASAAAYAGFGAY